MNLLTECIGYLAAALVLAAFCMRDIVALRWLALASNLAFIAYGALADLRPVLVLHLLLLPINLLRLRATSPAGQAASAPCVGGAPPSEDGSRRTSEVCDEPSLRPEVSKDESRARSFEALDDANPT